MGTASGFYFSENTWQVPLSDRIETDARRDADGQERCEKPSRSS